MTRELTAGERRQRADVLALLGTATARATDVRVFTNDDDLAAFAVFVDPDPPSEPVLGLTSAPSRGTFAAIAAGVAALIARGHSHGSFTTSDEQLLRVLERRFRIAPEAAGWAPNTGAETLWNVRVDLRDALEQLRK